MRTKRDEIVDMMFQQRDMIVESSVSFFPTSLHSTQRFSITEELSFGKQSKEEEWDGRKGKI